MKLKEIPFENRPIERLEKNGRKAYIVSLTEQGNKSIKNLKKH